MKVNKGFAVRSGAIMAAVALATAACSSSSGSSAPVSSAGSSAPVSSAGSSAPVSSAGSSAPVSSAGSSAPVSSAGSSAPASSSSPAKPEKTSLTFTYSNATMQVTKVPLHLTLASLKSSGWTTTEKFNKNGNDAVQQVARGDADFGVANSSTVLSAIKKGVPIKAVMVGYKPFYVLVAKDSIKKIAQLDGKRLGIQSQVSSTTLYGDIALATAPGTNPKTLIVPGSANRVNAMMANQLDAGVVQVAQWLRLKKKDPAKFHVLYNVPKKNPNLADSLVFASTKTLSQDPNYVRAFVHAVQKEYVSVYQDSNKLAEDLASLVPKTSKQTAAQLATMLEKDRIWPADGGLNSGSIEKTVKEMTSSGLFKADQLPKPSDAYNASFLSKTIGS